jgi:capsular exopolysaccharide synthesis family protein
MKIENMNSAVPSQEEDVDIKKIIFILLRQWYWFALFGALGFCGAIIYNNLSIQKYSISTSVLIPEKSSGLDMKELFEGTISQPGNNIVNQIEIIKSYSTVYETLHNLNWETCWYKKDLLVWKGIFNREPFTIHEQGNFTNPKDIPVFITPISETTYKISVNSEIRRSSGSERVNFNAEAFYGKVFSNDYFQFVLNKKENITLTDKDNFYFVFNDLNKSTLTYQRRISATLKDKNSDIIVCSIEGEDPVREGKFLNELINVLIAGKMKLQNEAQQRSLDFINQQLSEISDSLNLASNRYANFRSENNIIDIGSEAMMVLTQLGEIESQQAKSQMQLDYFKGLLVYLNDTADYKKVVSPSVVGVDDLTLNSLVMRLSELYSRRQMVLFSAKENTPSLLLIDNELLQTKTGLIENLRNLISNSTQLINSLRKQKESIDQQLNKLPHKEQQLINIQRQFELTNEIFTFLLKKSAEINIAIASNIPDVLIIDIARPETATPIGFKRKLVLILGFILGLFLPLLLILIKSFFDDRIRSQEDIENKTNLPILGNVMHNISKSDLIVYDNPKSVIAESFRGLRTNLQFVLTGTMGKVISVHSTIPGEGKSFISINLATIHAMNDKKVVIIGADLRRPKLHKIFDMKNDIGLSTYLIGYNTLDEIIKATPVPGLSFIPSGPIPPNPAEILGRPSMNVLLDELKSKFDYIIIDNAPVSLVTDGIIVGLQSDLNIFILRYGYSHKYQIEEINQYSENQKIKNIALVINDIKVNSFGYTYYKHYQYEYYHNVYYAEEQKSYKKYLKKKIKG